MVVQLGPNEFRLGSDDGSTGLHRVLAKPQWSLNEPWLGPKVVSVRSWQWFEESWLGLGIILVMARPGLDESQLGPD